MANLLKKNGSRHGKKLQGICRNPTNLLSIPRFASESRPLRGPAGRLGAQRAARTAGSPRPIAFVVEAHGREAVGIATTHGMHERHGKFGFGVLADRPYRRRGYAEDAVRLILRYGFMERRFHECGSACASCNPASIQLH